MGSKRTDLALEAREIWQEAAGKGRRLSGVKTAKRRVEGWPVTEVEVLTDQGAQALGKPQGRYITVDLRGFWQRRHDFFSRAVRAVGSQLRPLLPEEGTILVAALGNSAMTPDALGPLTADHLLITRHLIESMPQQFSGFRPVAAIRSGVLGITGVESAEAVRGLADRVQPAAVIAVDALASRKVERVCTAVQISDAGIVPGSGVGNRRWALNRETLGVPVIALGVPTVVDAATIAQDLLESAGLPAPDHDALAGAEARMTVTPRDIDRQVRDLGKVLGYAVNWALQDLDLEEMDALLS